MPDLLLHFGCFDLSLTPSMIAYTRPLTLNHEMMQNFINVYAPADKLKHPTVSPYYEDLTPFRGRLPSTLFTVGTEDPLLDDSTTMGLKWMMAGGEAIVKVYPGAAHGFISFPADSLGMYVLISGAALLQL
jgi:acetyl esterase/lipase